jgi:hypothetical protein
MARHLGKQGEWPRVTGNPDAFVQHPLVTERIDRNLTGPLRYGTSEGVGPRGRAVVASDSERSDLGMDRVSPAGFDPMGTALSRYGQQNSSDLISREIRGRRPRDKE